jgi:hypothetical protein
MKIRIRYQIQNLGFDEKTWFDLLEMSDIVDAISYVKKRKDLSCRVLKRTIHEEVIDISEVYIEL